MKKIFKRPNSVFLTTIFTLPIFLFGQNISANSALVFSTPPTQNVETTLKIYQPLVNYISETIGENIILKPAKNFREYSSNMRSGNYDIIFDGPHFINWRIKKQQHVVIAKQPGELHFAIVVKADSKIRELRHLWTKPVCAISVPHLSTLALIDLFNNPIREPSIVPVRSFKQGLQCLRDGRGVAALVRDKYWIKKAKKDGLKVIHITNRKMPARGLSVNKRIGKNAQVKITNALTSKIGHAYADKAFTTIGGGKFIKATTEEYSHLDDLIQIVFGFEMLK